MSTRLNPALNAVLLLVTFVPGRLLSQADTQAAHVVPSIAAPTHAPASLGPSAGHDAPEYQVTSIYDRVANRTRVSVVPVQPQQLSFDKRTMSVAVSITYRGRALVASPDSVELQFTTFSPARSGWAVAHPQPLRITLDDSIHLEYPGTDYHRMSVALYDRGRNEMLDFRIPTAAFLTLVESSRVKLQLGRLTLKLDQQGVASLRVLASRLIPTAQ